MHFGCYFLMGTQVSEDYYLSIGIEKSWVWALFVNLDFLGSKKRRGLKTRPKF